MLDIDPAILFALLLCLLPVANVLGASCCCASCAICSDDFDRGDDTDIDTGSACGWTEVSGSWDITSNQLRCTTAGVALCDTAHPDSNTTMTVDVSFQHATSGSACDVIVGYVDTTNWYYARYKVAGGSGSIDIRKNVGGSHSSIKLFAAVTMNTATAYTANVCVDEDGILSAALDGTAKVSASVYGISGSKCALGASGSGTAIFDDFVYTKTLESVDASACGDCVEAAAADSNCTNCDGSGQNLSAEWQAVITGNADYNGTYIIRNDAYVEVSQICLLRSAGPAPSGCAALTNYRLELAAASIRWVFANPSPTQEATWANSSGPSDCLSTGGPYALTNTGVYPGTLSPCPNNTGSTATVTPL